MAEETKAPTAAAAAPAAPVPKAEPNNPKAESVVALIEDWFVKLIHNSPLARDTAHYNRLFETKEELKQKVKAAITAS